MSERERKRVAALLLLKLLLETGIIFNELFYPTVLNNQKKKYFNKSRLFTKVPLLTNLISLAWKDLL